MSIIEVIFAPNVELARSVNADVTVEAEYGATVIEGEILTLAHHQKDGEYSQKEGAPAPCNSRAIIAAHGAAMRARLAMKGQITILVSHLDLDTVGGIAHIISEVSELGADTPMMANASFWRLAEWVDTNGPHKMMASPDASRENVRIINAYHATMRGGERFAQDKVTVVTNQVVRGIAMLNDAMCGTESVLAAGDRLVEENTKLDTNSFIEMKKSGVVVRCFSGFVNHLYGAQGRAVVAFNPATGAITISLADPVPGVSCREIVQDLFGPDAGGHDNIAGSPRGHRMSMMAWWDAVEALDMAIEGKVSL